MALALGACSPTADRRAAPNPRLVGQASGTTVLLQAVSAVDSLVVWASGHQATFVRTLDGGRTWQPGVVPGPDSLQFRDVHAVSADTAYLLAAGPGDMSRIYKTQDGGSTWSLQFRNTEPEGFFDCMDFWDAVSGLAFGDAVDGRLSVIRTENGGAEWEHVPAVSLPAALPGEGGFAASGTCLAVHGDRAAWFGTGASVAARVFRTHDRGVTWSVVATPIAAGTPTSGIMAVAFRDAAHGIVLGGELREPEGHTDNAATSEDGGRTWRLVGRPQLSGAVYGAAYVPAAPTPTVVAVGPRGADYTLDEGRTWVRLDTLSYWSVDFATPTAGWAVGPSGRITHIRLYP